MDGTVARESRAKRVGIWAGVSALALVPCFWLPRIEAGDLASHTYNAWLASLVEQGKAPGLWIAGQKNNILFDVLLLRLGRAFGFVWGERIAVCAAVLVFLWGAYALASAMGGRPARFLLPLLVALAYGWTFAMGFFNFYLSLGFAFAGLTILWQWRGWRRLGALPLMALMWLASPFGLLWFAAMGVVVVASQFAAPRWHGALTAGAAAWLAPLHFFLSKRYPLRWWQGSVVDLTGLDQLALGTRYEFVLWMLGLAIAGCVALHALRGRGSGRKWWEMVPLPAQLYVVGLVALAAVPDAIKFPQYEEPISLISSRFTLAAAVVGCGALNGLQVRKLFGVLSVCVTLTFFVLVRQDAVKTYAMEKKAEGLVAETPQDARIIATIYPFKGSRIFVHHVVARACIGHCFVIDNYEAPSKAFRLRAETGNRFVTASMDEANHMMIGRFAVRPEDLPEWQIYQCGRAESDLCLREAGGQ